MPPAADVTATDAWRRPTCSQEQACSLLIVSRKPVDAQRLEQWPLCKDPRELTQWGRKEKAVAYGRPVRPTVIHGYSECCQVMQHLFHTTERAPPLAVAVGTRNATSHMKIHELESEAY